MISVATLRAAGLTDAQIVKVLETDQNERAAARREQNRIAKKNQRSRQHVSADRADTADHADAPSKVPPITPLNTPQGSEAYASAPDGAQPEPVDEDPKAKLYRIGKTALVSFGIAEKRTGALIGQWLKTRNDAVGLLAAIQFARDQNVADPVAYVSTLIHGKGKQNGHKSNLSDLAGELAEEARKRERAAGIGRSDAPFRSS